MVLSRYCVAARGLWRLRGRDWAVAVSCADGEIVVTLRRMMMRAVARVLIPEKIWSYIFKDFLGLSRLRLFAPVLAR